MGSAPAGELLLFPCAVSAWVLGWSWQMPS